MDSLMDSRPPRYSAAASTLSEVADLDRDVTRLPDGTFYNRRLEALNVFELDVDESIVDEAAEIFYSSGCLSYDGSLGAARFDDVCTPEGRFFTQRVSGWQSNIAWVAVDDRQSFARFEEIFERLRLPQRFASVIPHVRSPRLYCAQFVVRSRCEGYNFHTDYNAAVGTNAISLITPLRDFKERAAFQLSFKATSGELQPDGQLALGTANAERVQERSDLRRYAYKKGKAIAFGSRFEHSTEPGAGQNGEVHAYLCFMFGTDDQSRWADIEKTMDAQARVIQQPDGELRLSALGQRIESALRNVR